MSRIVVVGATGLVGTEIVARLAALGYTVTGVARSVPRNVGFIAWQQIDLARADASDWHGVLRGAAVVVNCAGALQDSPADDLAGVHMEGLAELVAACQGSGVARFIHFSAMGVGGESPTTFSRSKRTGDDTLMASGIDYVILRPSVILGHPVGGASALIRGLAGLPLLPVMPETGPLRPVALDDVVQTVLDFIDLRRPGQVVLDMSGPETLSVVDLVRLNRRWLGLPPAREVAVPDVLAALAFRFGDAVSQFGWRPAVRSTARVEVARGAASDSRAWIEATGIIPRRIEAVLQARPPSVQDRWFARLYMIKPVIFVSLVLFWIGSGLASLGPGFGGGVTMMREAGTGWLAPLIVAGGGIADLVVGAGIIWRPTTRRALQAGIAVTTAYAAAGSILTPWLWLDPLAALLKTAPITALMLAALAVLEERS
ncbi:SDR family oxidoreductase [Phreatobacter sp.]|uniref:SDR family oxidoreductase n=1 Tax=Phreatobacter sp. TaxID=1966341 RepID=UPI0025CD28AB|nr:SDR family oxidoreductase [Phreatobacter sp.]